MGGWRRNDGGAGGRDPAIERPRGVYQGVHPGVYSHRSRAVNIPLLGTTTLHRHADSRYVSAEAVDSASLRLSAAAAVCGVSGDSRMRTRALKSQGGEIAAPAGRPREPSVQYGIYERVLWHSCSERGRLCVRSAHTGARSGRAIANAIERPWPGLERGGSTMTGIWEQTTRENAMAMMRAVLPRGHVRRRGERPALGRRKL